jgi:hypothetical protein
MKSPPQQTDECSTSTSDILRRGFSQRRPAWSGVEGIDAVARQLPGCFPATSAAEDDNPTQGVGLETLVSVAAFEPRILKAGWGGNLLSHKASNFTAELQHPSLRPH